MVGLDPTSLQIWYDRGLEDLRYDYKLNEGDIVIDLGAFEGEWAKRMVNQHMVKAVCVEPTAAIRGFGFAEVINAAAWVHDGTLEMSDDRFAGSIFGEHKTPFPCIDVAALIGKYERVAVVKCNCEGAEYKLLEHLIEQGVIKNVDHLQVQFHTIEGQPYRDWYEKLAEKLNDTHRLDWRVAYCWESWSKNTDGRPRVV